jgi:hypothetical protein
VIDILIRQIDSGVRVVRIDMVMACHRKTPYESTLDDSYAGAALLLLSSRALSRQDALMKWYPGVRVRFPRKDNSKQASRSQ